MKSVQAILGSRGTVTVDSLATVIDAARLMAAHRIGAVPVLDGSGLVGIFTERDVLTRVVAAGLDPAVTRVADVMSTQLVKADISETHETCLERMRSAHVRHLIIFSDDRMAGILSLRDLMMADLEEKAEHIAMLNA